MITHLKPGTTFANVYEVLELIAEGGMGAVYKVRNKELGSYLALKVMQSGLIRDQRMIERFVREAKTTASIESDHVVKVTDAGTWQPPDDARQPAIPYYVMELLDGQTLSRTIQDGGPFSWSRANQFFRELCHAIVAAHARQIVHRDLKPEYIA